MILPLMQRCMLMIFIFIFFFSVRFKILILDLFKSWPIMLRDFWFEFHSHYSFFFLTFSYFYSEDFIFSVGLVHFPILFRETGSLFSHFPSFTVIVYLRMYLLSSLINQDFKGQFKNARCIMYYYLNDRQSNGVQKGFFHSKGHNNNTNNNKRSSY